MSTHEDRSSESHVNTSHLNDAQFAAWIVGEREPAVAAHVAACDACRQEAEALATGLAGLRDTCYAAAERPEFFWSRQRATIHAQFSATLRPMLRWAPAVLATLLMAAALLLVKASAPQAPTPAGDNLASQSEQVAQSEQDEALLIEVQNDVGRTTPAALEPAQALADERDYLQSRLENRRGMR